MSVVAAVAAALAPAAIAAIAVPFAAAADVPGDDYEREMALNHFLY
jgi:hypothetical protein